MLQTKRLFGFILLGYRSHDVPIFFFFFYSEILMFCITVYYLHSKRYVILCESTELKIQNCCAIEPNIPTF